MPYLEDLLTADGFLSDSLSKSSCRNISTVNIPFIFPFVISNSLIWRVHRFCLHMKPNVRSFIVSWKKEEEYRHSVLEVPQRLVQY